MAARRVNMHYLTREAVELELNEGSNLDFSDSGSEENTAYSGEEFVPVDREVDSSDSNNDIFIFIIGIHETSRMKLFSSPCLDSSRFAVATEKGTWYYSMDYLSDKYTS